MGWVLKYRYLLLIILVVSAIITISFAVTFSPQKEGVTINPNFIYNTWKVEKLYKNGKLVINSNKYNDLFFQVNRDGSAEWIKGTQRMKLSFIISPDGTQIITDDGMRIEQVETVFELRPTLLRFGKRTINSDYEYVLTAVNVDGGNFLK
jgi:hypothetical protein